MKYLQWYKIYYAHCIKTILWKISLKSFPLHLFMLKNSYIYNHIVGNNSNIFTVFILKCRGNIYICISKNWNFRKIKVSTILLNFLLFRLLNHDTMLVNILGISFKLSNILWHTSHYSRIVNWTGNGWNASNSQKFKS